MRFRTIIFSIPVFVLGLFNGHAGDVPWDGEGVTVPGGLPDPRWDNDDNWAGDEQPGTGDRAILHPPINTSFVHFVLQRTEIGSIDCRVPLTLDNRLVFSGPSEFTDALLSDGTGSLETTSTVVFKGNNDARRVGFFGVGTFENQGTLLLEGDRAQANFINNGPSVILPFGRVSLERCVNNSALAIGEGAEIDSSSVVTNRGSLVFSGSLAATSSMTGTLVQESGTISVSADVKASITGGTQQYKGGTIQVESGSELLMSYSTGAIDGRIFDGLSSVSGSGDVNQRTPYVVRQDLNLEVVSPGRYSADDLDIESGVAVVNKQQMELPGGADLSGDGFFINQGTVTTVNNPELDVLTENFGTWNSTGFRIGTEELRNRSQMNLSGSNKSVNIVGGSNPGSLVNKPGGLISVDNGSQTFQILTPFEQEAGAETKVVNGTLQFFSGHPPSLAGTFSADTDAAVRFHSPVIKSAGPDTVINFSGEGYAYLGPGSALITCTLEAGTRLINNMSHLRQHSARLILFPGARIENHSGYFWRSGPIWSTEAAPGTRRFVSSGAITIEAGGTKQLGVEMINSAGRVNQYNTITLLDGTSTNGTGRIINGRGADWSIEGVANLQGRVQLSSDPDEVTFRNRGRLVNRHVGASTVVVDLLNEDLVWAQFGVLNLQNLHNLSASGELSGGRWFISPGADLNFATDVVALRNGADWSGPIGTIERIGGSSTNETKSTLQLLDDVTLTDALEVKETGHLKLAFDKTLTLTDNLTVRGRISGTSRIIGKLTCRAKWGVVAPGSSPGTLSIDGDLDLEDAAYEWETLGIGEGESDLLVVSNGVATLSGSMVPILLEGYVPTPGTVFTTLVASAISGQFDFVSHAHLPFGMGMTATHTADAVTLTVGSASYASFGDWQAAMFSPSNLVDTAVSGPAADPEGDRIKNLAEYAHGLPPGAVNDEVLLISHSASGTVDLYFPWVDGLSDVTYAVVAAPTLEGVFAPVPHTLISSVSSNGVSAIRLRVAVPPGTPRMVYQLKVEDAI